MKTQDYLNNLGRKAVDRITEYDGVITSVSFDVNGCIQYCIKKPGTTSEGKLYEGYWFDAARCKLSGSVVDPPNFESNEPLVNGNKGPAEKPSK